MTDRFVTVPDSLELPAAVKVPSARLSDSGATGRAALAAADAAALRAAAELGSAATTAATDYATAAQGDKADAADVDQIVLTGNLALTVPAGFPAGQVYRVTLTQDGTGGHTVTYNDLPVTVDTTAGAQTEVELWPNGAATRTVVYPGAAGSGVDTEGVQDVVGAMVAAAGGTYDDAAGTIILPTGGGSGGYPVQQIAVTAAHVLDTSAWPTTEVVTVVLAQDAVGGHAVTHDAEVMMASGVTWAPSEAPLSEAVAVFRYSPALELWVCEGLWVSYAPIGVDTTAPTVTSLTVTGSGASGSTRTLTVAGAADPEGLPSAPYRFSLNAGATWTAWQSAAAYTTGALAAATYSPRAEVRNTSGLTATVSAADFTVAAAEDTTAPVWTPTLTPGTITDTAAPFTASALATDNVAPTGYQVDPTGAGSWAAIVPAGNVFTLTGLTAATAYTAAKLRAYDAAGNYSTPPVSVPSFTTAAAAWSPAALTPALWLDAADTATITTPSGVTSWASKGSGSWAAVQDVLSSRPTTGVTQINGKNVVTFDSADALRVNSFSGLGGSNKLTIWFVGTAPAGGDRIVVELSDNVNTNDNAFMLLRTNGNQLQTNVRMGGATVLATTTGAGFTTTPQVFVATWDMSDPSAETHTYVNGTANSTSSIANNSTTGTFATSYNLNIAARAMSSLYLAGGIADMGLIAGVPTLGDRQRIEGYLAHKWGLTANLPAEHPYKSVAP